MACWGPGLQVQNHCLRRYGITRFLVLVSNRSMLRFIAHKLISMVTFYPWINHVPVSVLVEILCKVVIHRNYPDSEVSQYCPALVITKNTYLLDSTEHFTFSENEKKSCKRETDWSIIFCHLAYFYLAKFCWFQSVWKWWGWNSSTFGNRFNLNTPA